MRAWARWRRTRSRDARAHCERRRGRGERLLRARARRAESARPRRLGDDGPRVVQNRSVGMRSGRYDLGATWIFERDPDGVGIPAGEPVLSTSEWKAPIASTSGYILALGSNVWSAIRRATCHAAPQRHMCADSAGYIPPLRLWIRANCIGIRGGRDRQRPAG